MRQGVRVPLGTGFAGTIAASGSLAILNRVDHSVVNNQLLTARSAFGPEDTELRRLARCWPRLSRLPY